MVSLNVNLKLNTTQRKFIRLENISTDMLVSDLKKEIIFKAGLDDQATLEILYCCQILKDETTLKLLEGSSTYKMIHAVCVEPVSPQDIRKLSSSEQQQLVVSFRTAMSNPHFRQTLQEVASPNSIKNLVSSVPGLAEDNIALSMLQDWELLLHIADPKCVQTLVERHPSLADAATKITATFQNSFPPTDPQQRRRPNGGWFARSIGADVDEDGMETEAPSGQAGAPGHPSGSSGLTPAQFAAALAFVNQSLAASSPSNAPRPTPSTVTPPAPVNLPVPSAINTILTPEMLNQALRQAMSSVTSPSSSSSSTTTATTTSTTSNERLSTNPSASRSVRVNREEVSLREQFGRFLPQMRELGITDDLLSLRALQATNGDVQAAVNLVFAGLVDD